MASTSRSGDFEHESLQDTASIGKYLEALAAGFRDGTLEFASGKKAIKLEPTGLLELTLKARKKDGDARLQIDVHWKEPKRKKKTQPPLEIHPGGRS